MDSACVPAGMRVGHTHRPGRRYVCLVDAAQCLVALVALIDPVECERIPRQSESFQSMSVTHSWSQCAPSGLVYALLADKNFENTK